MYRIIQIIMYVIIIFSFNIFIQQIGRLSPFYFPVEIELVGNPLISRINNLEPRGLQDNKDTPELVLIWNTMPVGNPVVRRTFWVFNSSPFNMVIEWKLMKEVEEKEEENIAGELDENKEIINENGEGGEGTERGEEREGGEGGKGTEGGKEGEGEEGEEGAEIEEGEGEEAKIIEEPKLPNLCHIIFNIEENRENTLHCMLVPERNGEEWCVRVCFHSKQYPKFIT